jgi:hemerythrin-like domain-containing protein
MTYVVEVLRQEHRNIEKSLQLLEQKLSVFDRGDHPNYEVVVGIMDYFKDYPDSCHHPKENMIFDKLKSRDPAAAARIVDLRIEHEEEASRLRRAAQAVERVLADQDLLRETVDEIVRDFIEHERQHMQMEEQILFPTALNALRPKDWADIALKLADGRDPLNGPDLEQKFSLLRRKILEIEAEAEAERLT